MSTIARYLEASLRLMQPANGAVISGANCVIDEKASVERSVLWDNVTVEAGARVRDSVLAEGVRVPAGALIDRSVVVGRDIVRQIERGEIVGDQLIVPIG
jgi:NDP-sugar pyrophosphorylase family protein